MTAIEVFHILVAVWLFALGAVVGSFINVCIYRIPWQKSVIWPASHCPKCLRAINARDNIPILSWLALRGECRSCGLTISKRYALIELLVGLLFVGVFIVDVAVGRSGIYGMSPYGRMLFHLLLVCLLVVATFIDYDLQIIPDEVTIPGMLLALVIGTIWPGIRPEPATAATHLGGLASGLIGMAAGAGLTWIVRLVFSTILRREAMGFGDVTLMGLIGSVMGWQAGVLAFFIAPFLGLGHAGWKLVKYIAKRIKGIQTSSADRELAFGPYLSMAATLLLLVWPWLWRGWARWLFSTLGEAPGVIWFLITGDPGPE